MKVLVENNFVTSRAGNSVLDWQSGWNRIQTKWTRTFLFCQPEAQCLTMPSAMPHFEMIPSGNNLKWKKKDQAVIWTLDEISSVA